MSKEFSVAFTPSAQVPWICDKQIHGVASPLGKCKCQQITSFNMGHEGWSQISYLPCDAQKGVWLWHPFAFHYRTRCENSRPPPKKGGGGEETILDIYKLADVTPCHLPVCWLWPSDVILQQAERDGCLCFLLTSQGSCLVGTKWHGRRISASHLLSPNRLPQCQCAHQAPLGGSPIPGPLSMEYQDRIVKIVFSSSKHH